MSSLGIWIEFGKTFFNACPQLYL